MSAQDPRFPSSGITLRVQRDDGLTFAGVTVPAEIFSIALARTRLAAATGLSAGEIARANLATFPGAHVVRDPMVQGSGWCLFNSAAGRVVYILRDDSTHLSVSYPQTLFTVPKAQAALNATAGLSGAEQARIAAVAL